MKDYQPIRKLIYVVVYHTRGVHSDFATLQALLPMFLSPTLTDIHISCTKVQGMVDLPEGGIKTPLKHLNFEECSFEASTLHALLGLPKNLTSLHLGEEMDNFRYKSYINEHIDSVLDAISRQSHSLEYLHHNCRVNTIMFSTYAPPVNIYALSYFEVLTTLQMNCHSLFQKLFLPTTLMRFCMTRLDCSRDWQALKFLRQLDMPGLHVEVHVKLFSGTCTPWTRAKEAVEVARALRDKSITVTFVEIHDVPHPPWLYDERTPRRDVFDSTLYWAEEEKYVEEREAATEAGGGRQRRVISDGDDFTVRALKLVAGGYRAR